MKGYKWHSKEKVRWVIRLYCRGWGQRKISDFTGVSEAVVVRMLRGQHRYNNRRLMNGKRSPNRIRSNTRQFGGE